jgi:hypothetical protein
VATVALVELLVLAKATAAAVVVETTDVAAAAAAVLACMRLKSVIQALPAKVAQPTLQCVQGEKVNLLMRPLGLQQQQDKESQLSSARAQEMRFSRSITKNAKSQFTRFRRRRHWWAAHYQGRKNPEPERVCNGTNQRADAHLEWHGMDASNAV